MPSASDVLDMLSPAERVVLIRSAAQELDSRYGAMPDDQIHDTDVLALMEKIRYWNGR